VLVTGDKVDVKETDTWRSLWTINP